MIDNMHLELTVLIYTNCAFNVEKLKWGQILTGRVFRTNILTEVVKPHCWMAFILDPKILKFRFMFRGGFF